MEDLTGKGEEQAEHKKEQEARRLILWRTERINSAHLEVGLESGKTTGRSLHFAMSSTTSLVNVPGVPEVPIRIVGLTLAIVSASCDLCLVRAGISCDFGYISRICGLEILQSFRDIEHDEKGESWHEGHSEDELEALLSKGQPFAF
jgi:hypothetical protein